MKKKIIIIEQDEITRRTLETILSCDENLVILGSHESSEGILKQIMKLSPHLIIIGLEGNHHEITTAMAIKKDNPDLKVMFISSNVNEDFLASALRTGANSFCALDLNYREIRNAIQATLSGESYLSPKVTKSLVKSYHSNPFSPLTKKESEVVKHLVNGYTYTEIGDIIGISKETVKTHLKNIYKKIEVNKKSELIYKLKKNKLLTQ